MMAEVLDVSASGQKIKVVIEVVTIAKKTEHFDGTAVFVTLRGRGHVVSTKVHGRKMRIRRGKSFSMWRRTCKNTSIVERCCQREVGGETYDGEMRSTG